jgi:ferredoxin/flavodoxin---NADP+ reductase
MPTHHDTAVVGVDLLIVGAGPTGLFGAYHAGFRGSSVAVLWACQAGR